MEAGETTEAASAFQVVKAEGVAKAEAADDAADATMARSAAAAIVPVARDLQEVDRQVRSGQLRLDPEAANRLLATLNELKARVHKMIANSDRTIDRVLKFGDNFVGDAMGRRFREAASGDGTAMLTVLEEFATQLDTLEATVRRAAGLVVAVDTDAKETFERLGGKQ